MIFHIAEADAWREARTTGWYRRSTRGRSLDEVGFIHCSRRHQVEPVANAFYRDAGPLVLLTIDTGRVDVEVIEERAEGVDTFPHIYGPLPVSAVVDVDDLRPAPRGLFVPPRSWISPKLEVGQSTIDGLGLFAVERIDAGETVAVMGGQPMSSEEFARYLAAVDSWSAAAVEEDLNVVQDHQDLLRRGNHSCDPELWMADELQLVARRPIPLGQEATIDYALLTVDEDWRMACRCRRSTCRHIITGADWRRADLQARYRGHFSPFIQRRISPAS
jgi:uncharacterized protein (DUF952 family)